MKISNQDILNKKIGLLSRIIYGSSLNLINDIMEKDGCDVVLTINGQEVDIQTFFTDIENNINNFIHEESKRIISDNFADLQNKITETEESFKCLYDVLEDKFNKEME